MIDKLIDWADRATGYRFRGSGDDSKLGMVIVPVLLILLLLTLLGIYWSDEPDPFDIEEAAAEFERALALDDRLPEAHTALGRLRCWFDWDWQLGIWRAGAVARPGTLDA